MTAEEIESQYERARRQVGLSQQDLFVRYFALGGDAGVDEFEAFLHGALKPEREQQDILVHALNERSMELGSARRWPYVADRRAGPGDGTGG